MLRSVPSIPKFKRLQRLLKLRRWEATGLLQALWHMTGEHAPRGDIGRWTNEEIADGIEWWDRGDPDDLIAALVQCRWLDEHPEHRLVVHDWPDHADRAVRQKRVIRDRGFAVSPRVKACQPVSRREHAPARAPERVSQRTEDRGRRTTTENNNHSRKATSPARTHEAGVENGLVSGLLRNWYDAHDGEPPDEPRARKPDAYRTRILHSLLKDRSTTRDQVGAGITEFTALNPEATAGAFADWFEDRREAGKREATRAKGDAHEASGSRSSTEQCQLGCGDTATDAAGRLRVLAATR